MKRWLATAVTLLALVSALTLFAQMASAAKDQAQGRELRGAVTTRADAPVADAIVYLKNTKTLTVKTFITGHDGQYRFPALAQNVDYEVFAEYRGKRSDVKTLSSFDSRPQAYINLKIDTGK